MGRPFITGRIIYSPRAVQQLDNLDEWISKAASPTVARQFVSAVIARIDSILVFPHAGAPRDEIRPGMRTRDLQDANAHLVRR
ncbi:MAG TPA: type II toxin-antitoxin system RelE/ParE family toxin [Marmoricola sp.]|nr:type II toxin-antitoxin system RelE/ParE family toxin [Nocardioidaceae bacterium]HRV68199.1 type II toxin-antitoxin system RelE/ParE family toxin [Marmoricola sp.]